MGFFDWLLGKKTESPLAQATIRSEELDVRNVAYATWSCLGDTRSCEACRTLEGACWIPGMAAIPEPPLPSCESPEGCRCMAVYVDKRESGATEIADFIRQSGDHVTRKQMAEYEHARQAPALKRNDLARQASDKALGASKLEKESPEEAISLYRESIAIHRELADSADPWNWRDFPYLYNRLTLLLEKLGRRDEALREIEAYENLSCEDAGSKSDREAIVKRKMRLS